MLVSKRLRHWQDGYVLDVREYRKLKKVSVLHILAEKLKGIIQSLANNTIWLGHER